MFKKSKTWRVATKKGRVAKRWLKRHGTVYDIIISLLLVGVIFFGVRGALCLSLQTDDPYRAVISNSMRHGDESWKNYFTEIGYDNSAISNFPLQGGFERGDLMFVRGVDPLKDIAIGDVIIVERGPDVTPLVHRVVEIWEENGEIWFKTKGDANPKPFEFYYEEGKKVPGDYPIRPRQILGKVVFVIPKLGYPSLWWQGQ
jgi:signal peptidase I